MYYFFKSLILSILKVPPKPSLPIHEEGSEVKIFRASYNYYRYIFYLWLIKTIFTLGCELGVGMAIFLEMLYKKSSFLNISVFIIIGILLFGISALQRYFSYIMLRLDYEMRWYIITDRSIRIREGVTMVKEMTMTIANIQNMEVTQGPIQRLFGISDIKVETAGGGRITEDMNNNINAGSAMMHAAYFRGVDNSSEIMEMLKKRLELFKTSGLGDNIETSDSDKEEMETEVFSAAEKFISNLQILRNEVSLFRSSLVKFKY